MHVKHGLRVDHYRDSHQSRTAAAAYRHTYERGYYAALWKRVECPLLESVFRELGGAERTCLDFACGTGRIATVAGRYFGEVVGVDISEAMLRYVPAQLNVEYFCTDITRTPLDRSFDVATAFRFFLNAEADLRTAALCALYRHLVPGGRLVCNIHVNASSPMGLFYRLWDRTVGGAPHNTFRTGEFVELLRAHGFAAEQVRPYGYWPRPGPLMPKLCELAIEPTEKICSALKVPGAIAQNVLIVARKS